MKDNFVGYTVTHLFCNSYFPCKLGSWFSFSFSLFLLYFLLGSQTSVCSLECVGGLLLRSVLVFTAVSLRWTWEWISPCPALGSLVLPCSGIGIFYQFWEVLSHLFPILPSVSQLDRLSFSPDRPRLLSSLFTPFSVRHPWGFPDSPSSALILSQAVFPYVRPFHGSAFSVLLFGSTFSSLFSNSPFSCVDLFNLSNDSNFFMIIFALFYSFLNFCIIMSSRSYFVSLNILNASLLSPAFAESLRT